MRKPAVAPELLLNRELQVIEFNRRVLALAEDPDVPLLERLRFLCIVDSNLDEFFEIRVAGLKEEIRAKAPPRHDGMPLEQVLKVVSERARELVERQYRVLNGEVLPRLAEQGIRFLRQPDWSEKQKAWVRAYFEREVKPVLTPLGLDPAHAFPRPLNKRLNFAVEVEGKDALGRTTGMAVVQAPRVLPRVVVLPAEVAGPGTGLVYLSSILRAHVGALFPGMSVRGCYQFQLTRNSDLYIDEEERLELKSLRRALQRDLTQRHYGDSVRLEVADRCPPHVCTYLLQQFGLDAEDLYQIDGPVNLTRLAIVPEQVDRPDLKFPAFTPVYPPRLKEHPTLFDAIRAGDVLLHHPYESFLPVIEFIQQAAHDPRVVAIKQTVYRVGAQSEMMNLLIAAARNGKEVTVVVELMARFDEEANISWAQRLEEAGAHVVYGVVGHKTHAKMAMVVRREEDRLCRYVHLGTGNYHSRTALLYTDFGLLTCHEGICSDVNEIFMQLTGFGREIRLKHLWQSPFTLQSRLKRAIQNETKEARSGRQGRIIARMNALLEPEIIAALYEASQAGVEVDLVVRGACALKPGVAGVSDRIRVRSILGRFLEHSRVFYFWNGGAEDVYLASADWMDRNFFRRIEVCVPVLDPEIRKRVIREGLMVHVAATDNAWEMQPDGAFQRRRGPRGKGHNPQTQLLAELASGAARGQVPAR